MKKARTKRRSVKRSKKIGKRPTKKKVVKKPAKKTKKIVRKPKKKVIKKKIAKKIARKKTRRPTKKLRKRVVKKKTRRKPRASRRARQHAKLVAGKRKKRKVAKRKPVKRKTIKIKSRKKVKKKRKIIRKKRLVKKISRKGRRKRKKVRAVRRGYSKGGSLEQLFESPTKVQVMKLFFRNPEANFLLKEAAKIMRINLAAVRKEIKKLEKIGLLKSRQISPRKQVFIINPNFDFFNEMRELVLKASPVSKEKMLKATRRLGKIKLVLLSGVFMGSDISRADLLIVGDNINQRKLNTFIKNLEAEAGTDVNCVVMTTEEFNYRYDMYDRFVRDLLSDKCEFLINRLNI